MLTCFNKQPFSSHIAQGVTPRLSRLVAGHFAGPSLSDVDDWLRPGAKAAVVVRVIGITMGNNAGLRYRQGTL